LPAQNIGLTFKPFVIQPFVMGADGTLGIHAAEVIEDTLARKLTKQWDTSSYEQSQSAWSCSMLDLQPFNIRNHPRIF
jgi:hypothetical protein